jgi:hypothetical protein
VRVASAVLIPPATALGEYRFGSSVAGIGDLNGDGFSDVAVGAPLYGNGNIEEGAVFVYLGSSTGLVTTAHRVLEINSIHARLGAAVASAGDVNGDNLADLLVGAPQFGEEEINGFYGAAFLYPGASNGIATTPSWAAYGTSGGAYFGTARVCRRGDRGAKHVRDVAGGGGGVDVSRPTGSDRAWYDACLERGGPPGECATGRLRRRRGRRQSRRVCRVRVRRSELAVM